MKRLQITSDDSSGSGDASEQIDKAGRYHVFEINQAIADVLEPMEEVLAVDRNVEVSGMAAITPKDEYFGVQCGLTTIKAPAAWGLCSTPPCTSSDVRLALVDTGVEVDHPDLLNSALAPIWSVNTNGADDNGHGTHMAGLLSAQTNDKDGIVGVSWAYKSLKSYKGLDDNARGTLKTVLKAMDEALTESDKPHIVVLGWGTDADDDIRSLYLKIRENAGILFVAAAGNTGLDNDSGSGPKTYPAAYGARLDNLISVMSVDCPVRPNELPIPSAFSNRGTQSVHLAAPGDGSHPTYRIYSSILGKKYGRSAGTSMAAAFVTGAAALVRQKHNITEPRLIREHLINTTSPLAPGYEAYCRSGGYLNLEKALQ